MPAGECVSISYFSNNRSRELRCKPEETTCLLPFNPPSPVSSLPYRYSCAMEWQGAGLIAVNPRGADAAGVELMGISSHLLPHERLIWRGRS